MVSEAVLVAEKPSGNSTASTYPVEFSKLPIHDYEIGHAVYDQKPGYAVAEPDVSLEWVSVFKVLLHKLQSRIYELVEPILIQIERYGDGYLVTDENVYRHGVGSTIEASLRNYEEILLGYFESLCRRQERLSPRLRQDFEFLRRTISHT